MMCFQYWPTADCRQSTLKSNGIEVSLLGENEICSGLIESKLNVKQVLQGTTLKEIDVTLIRFSGWPDCDLPTKTSESMQAHTILIKTLLQFYIENNSDDNKKRAIVHCS